MCNTSCFIADDLVYFIGLITAVLNTESITSKIIFHSKTYVKNPFMRSE